MAYLISYGVELLTIVLAGVIFYFWSKSFIRTSDNGKIRIGVSVIVALAIMYGISFLPNRLILFVLSILVLVLLGLSLFQEDRKAVLFYTLTYCAIGLSIYSVVSIVKLAFPALITVVIQGALCIVIMKCMRNSSKAYAIIRYPSLIVIPLLFSALQISICSLEWMDSKAVMKNELLVCLSAIVIAVSVLMLYLIKEFSDTICEKEELKLRMTKEVNEKRHYQNMEEQHEQYDVLIHDMKHVMRTMAVLSKGENSDDIAKLAERIDLAINKISNKEYCSDKVLNALLLERISFAKEKGVELDLNIVEPMRLSKIEELDLITMMGNLLDNAIIAESKVKNPKVENSYEGKFFQKKARPEGKPGAKHGIGLNSIEEIVRKYGGIMESSVENGRYWTKIVIPT